VLTNCLEEFDNEGISWMLFVDGCALLQILEHTNLKKNNVKFEQLILVLQDVLLLENQLPCTLLKLLWRGNNDMELMYEEFSWLPSEHYRTSTGNGGG